MATEEAITVVLVLEKSASSLSASCLPGDVVGGNGGGDGDGSEAEGIGGGGGG